MLSDAIPVPKGTLLRVLGVGFGVAVSLGNSIGAGIMRKFVQEDKQIDQARHDHKPEAPGSSRNEPLSDIDEAPNPENLTRERPLVVFFPLVSLPRLHPRQISL